MSIDPGTLRLDIDRPARWPGEQAFVWLLEFGADIERDSIGTHADGTLVIHELVNYWDHNVDAVYWGVQTRSGSVSRHMTHRLTEFYTRDGADAAYEAAVRQSADDGVIYTHTDVAGVPVAETTGGAA
ncbi:hypothetical protein AB0I28_31460 [Phytomonospora sp. NPDC050363]|uniref:hypothetical protein n=1 Tax=Phytomonospora sp. NPDC050363 TaxID=3155642 RepID=UPI0033CE2F8F